MVSIVPKYDPLTYMNRPVSFLHVVRCEDVGHTSQPVQQVILESEHGSRPDDRRLREDVANNSLTLSLFKP
jgi:hypothetical protein